MISTARSQVAYDLQEDFSQEDIPVEVECRFLKQLCDTPSVWYIENFLNDAECAHFIGLADQKLQRSLTVSQENGAPAPHEARTSWQTFVPRESTPIVAAVERRIAELMQMPLEYGESFQVLRYEIGQEYKPHYDYFDPAKPTSEMHLKRGGQRYATLLLYLNDVEAGGETIFPKVDLKVKPIKGDCLIFYNVYDDGKEDPQSMHGSVPVEAGEKWVATKWIRQGEFV